MECRCFEGLFSESPQELTALQRGIGPGIHAVLEGWVCLVTSSAPRKSREVYARLTADTLGFYKDKPQMVYDPVQIATVVEGTASPSDGIAPEEVVLLAHIASVLGRSQGSQHVRLSDGRGKWWQLTPASPELVTKWAEALAKRFDKFKTARRRSSMYTAVQQDDLKQQLEAASQQRRPWRRLLALLPCAPRRDFSEAVGGSFVPYRGSREGVGDLVDQDALSQVTDADLMEAQALHWSDSAVTFLQTCKGLPEDLLPDFLYSVRKGVPDGLKRLIWPLAAGQALASKVSDVNADDVYNNLLERSFGGVHPHEFQDPVPTFCQGVQGVEDAPALSAVVKHLWLLKPQGQHTLRRLLWVSQLTSNHVEFCPFLPNLMATLLSFFTEAETMFIVRELLLEAENAAGGESPKIILNLSQMQKQAKLLVREGKMRGIIPNILAHLESLGLNTEEVATRLLQDGLASKLNFRALCRLVGAFLGEGSEVILRFALALLKQSEEALLACSSSHEVMDFLETMIQRQQGNHEEVNALTKVAYSLPLRNLSMARVSSSWKISYAAPKQAYEKHMFCRPRLYEPRGSVPDEIWEAIWPWVPANCRVFDPHLIYTPVVDGTSLRTCLEKCKKCRDAAMCFFVYSEFGDMLGGFSPVIWARTSGYLDLMTSFRAAEDAFVFRRLQGKSTVDVFTWTGANQMLMQASELHGLIFGGDDAAVHVNKDLTRATSSASRSFSSPPLLEESHGESKVDGVRDSFEICRFEVFALL